MAGAVIETPIDRWLERVSVVGTAIEKEDVRHLRDDGRLCRSNQPGRSTDPDAPGPQMGFVDTSCWLSASLDAPVLPLNGDKPVMIEFKTQHESKIDEMALGERGPKDEHRRQLLCALGLAHEFGQDAFLHPTEDRVLAPPDEGVVFYVARDEPWPGPVKTWEFFFSYDPDFMEAGRAHLRSWRQAFLEEELPQPVPRKNTRSHPYGWKWSEGRCRFCTAKKRCRADYDAGVTSLPESRAVSFAALTFPDYDYAQQRRDVLGFWAKQGDDDARAALELIDR